MSTQRGRQTRTGGTKNLRLILPLSMISTCLVLAVNLPKAPITRMDNVREFLQGVAAEWLINNRYTEPSRLAISGGSNGGLLVGAALTQRPDLFQAVVCSYPLLDMVRYHKFLIARFWVPEYGSADDPQQFKFIHAYSPYHRVTKGTNYPAVLFMSGDADTRVAPLHARKMAALLQSATGSNRPVLLRYDTKAGHVGGTAPVGKRIDDLTDELSFLFSQLRAGNESSQAANTKN